MLNFRTACVLAALALGPTLALAAPRPEPLTFEMALPEAAPPAPGKRVARFTAIPFQGPSADVALSEATAGSTVPMWSTTVTDGTAHFKIKMIGGNPEVKLAKPATTINSFLIPVVVNFKSFGIFFDPTLPDPTCAKNAVPLTLVAQSPLFNDISITVGGTALGSGQYVDLFQRANFFKFTGPGGINPGYHVTLAATALPTAKVTLNVTGGPAPQAGVCGGNGEVPFATFDNFIRTKVFPALPAEVATNTLPVFVLYGVVLSDSGGCCIIGYHSALSRAGVVQTYAVADYDTTRSFTALSDISAMSHEIAEWLDDPLANNPTKPWGNIGQVTSCQSNLEVGDPLSGNPLAKITMPANHVTYHVQDLAFLSWFYHQTPSIGVNGWYSLFGRFRTPAAPCP